MDARELLVTDLCYVLNDFVLQIHISLKLVHDLDHLRFSDSKKRVFILTVIRRKAKIDEFSEVKIAG